MSHYWYIIIQISSVFPQAFLSQGPLKDILGHLAVTSP